LTTTIKFILQNVPELPLSFVCLFYMRAAGWVNRKHINKEKDHTDLTSYSD